MGAYEVDGTQSSVVVRYKDVRIQKKSNGLVTLEKEPVKNVRPKKTPKSRRNGSQDSQSQGNVQATDERIKLLPTQLDNERREHQQKDVLVKKLSTEMTEKDAPPMGAYEVDGTQSSVVVRYKDVRIQKKSNGLVTLEKEPVKNVRPKKTPKSRRNGSQDSQSQGNVSPTQELPTIFISTCVLLFFC
nr:hypothetical protein [Tanacetum cinerariifolium]